MGNDTFTETTTKSWLSRIKGALSGLIIGPLLIIGAVCLLWWNEGRTIRTATGLAEGQKAVATVSSDAVNSAYEGKLVYLTGKANTEEMLEDPDFDVQANALLLQRKTEMYQWHEKKESTSKKNLGGSETTETTYSYHKDWSDRLVDSSGFKKPDGHSNPDEFTYPPMRWVAESATLGAFQLTEEVIEMIGGEKKIPVEEDLQDEEGETIGTALNGSYYMGKDPKNPQVGDERVSFFAVSPTEISVVAAQQGNSLGTYLTANETSILLVKSGVHSAEVLFSDAQSQNTLIAWLIRGGGLLLAVIGFAMLMSLLSVLGDVVPLVGRIIGFGTGLVALVLGTVVAGFTIAIAWFAYRPLLSIGIILGVVAVVFMVRRRKTTPKLVAQRAETSPPPLPPR